MKKREKSGNWAHDFSGGSGGSAFARFWLVYPPDLIQHPILWEVGMKFDVRVDIRQACSTTDIAVVCLQLIGNPQVTQTVIKWLENRGVRVLPVELEVFEG